MEIGIIISMLGLMIVGLGIIIGKNIKQIKKLAENKKLEELTKRIPENKEICEEMLKILDNGKTKVKESEDNKTNLYVIATDTILISNSVENFTRIQTIAHECIHSLQSKYLQWFHFFFSIFWNVFYGIMIILAVLGKIENSIWILSVFLLCSFTYYVIRSYLEMEAMLKAKEIAYQYLQRENKLSQTEIKELISAYETLNTIGVKTANYNLFEKELVKLFIYCIIVM